MRPFLARLKIAFQVVLALLAALWLLHFLDSPFFESRLDRVIEQAPFIWGFLGGIIAAYVLSTVIA